jgi:hypothetical protein
LGAVALAVSVAFARRDCTSSAIVRFQAVNALPLFSTPAALLLRRRMYTITTVTVIRVTRMTATAIPALVPVEAALLLRAIALALHRADIASRSSSVRQHVRLTHPHMHGDLDADTEIVGDAEAVTDLVSLKDGVLVGGSDAPTLLVALDDLEVDFVGDVVGDADSDDPMLMDGEGETVSDAVVDGVTEVEGVTGVYDEIDSWAFHRK